VRIATHQLLLTLDRVLSRSLTGNSPRTKVKDKIYQQGDWGVNMPFPSRWYHIEEKVDGLVRRRLFSTVRDRIEHAGTLWE